MKKFLLSLAMLGMAVCGRAETQDVCMGWPADYDGVMLQGFWWDGYSAAKWSALTARANELSQYFDLIWVPNSGTCSGDPEGSQDLSMGYDPCYWLHHNSCFGTEAELRTMINTYKAKGVGIIEDVVINHKKGVTGWLDFAQETVTGQVTNQVYTVIWDNENYRQICKTDDCNYYEEKDGTKPYQTNGADDTGDDFAGYRDLDHTNDTTRNNVKTYLDFLLNELGYTGFRYDMVKGYSAGYIQEYNNYAMPEFSVGEFWDDQTNIQNWIMGTGNTSAAFDFPLKFKLNDAISNGNYSALEYKSFTYDNTYKRLSVTFADNHDTGREDTKLANNWSAANAFLLASPGTPCIWYPHYNADPTNIRAMILARKACGITNTNCDVQQQYATDDNRGYVMESYGSEGSVYVLLGEAAYSKVGEVPSKYTLVAEGDAYKFYSSVANFASVKVSPDGGAFTSQTLDVTLEAVNATTAWYTIGADAADRETFNGTTTFTIGLNSALNEDITIYWGATGEDGVEHTGSTTFTKRTSYNTPEVEDDEVSVFYETNDRTVYIWAWDDDKNNYTGGDWDNKPLMELMGVNDAGKLVYKWTYTGDLTSEPTQLLFVTEELQTPDFEFVNHGYYTESGLSYKVGENSVYLINAAGWSDVYCYAFNGEVLGAWPGTKATYDSEQSCYAISFDSGRPANIIWNNNQGEQTQNLSCEIGKTYVNNIAYFKNTEGWENVYCYAWDGDNQMLGAWPGTQARANNDGLFYMVFTDDEPANIIWHNNAGDKTEDLVFENGQVYDSEGGEYYTLYFNNTAGWNDVYCYTWNAQGNGGDWPGAKITAKDYETASGGYYKALVNSNYVNVIFSSSAGSQTKDLKVKDGSIYTPDDEVGSEGNGYWPEDNSLFFASSDKVEGINVVMNEDGFDYCELLVLTDKVPFVNTKVFTALEVSYGRANSSYKWGTIFMPFNLTSDESIQYYTLKSVTDEQMTFKPVDEVEANTPAIYQVLGDGFDIYYQEPVEVMTTGTGSASVQPVSDWTMVGTYSVVPELESGDGKYVYYIGNDQFWLAETGYPIKMSPFRAWFETTNAINAAKLRIAVEGEAEGIQTIEQDKNQGEIIYDLMGRQQDWTRKGIVVKNGSVIFVK